MLSKNVEMSPLKTKIPLIFTEDETKSIDANPEIIITYIEKLFNTLSVTMEKAIERFES